MIAVTGSDTNGATKKLFELPDKQDETITLISIALALTTAILFGVRATFFKWVVVDNQGMEPAFDLN